LVWNVDDCFMVSLLSMLLVFLARTRAVMFKAPTGSARRPMDAPGLTLSLARIRAAASDEAINIAWSALALTITAPAESS
jgi:hypothetical protein